MLEKFTPLIHELADQHIALANEQSQKAVAKHVSAGLSLAAANFAVYLSAKVSTDQTDFAAQRATHLAFFTDEFRRMFEQYYDDYVRDYDQIKHGR